MATTFSGSGCLTPMLEYAAVGDGRRGESDRRAERLLYNWFTRPSLLLEQRAGLELAQLFTSPVYYGAGIPRGDHAPVLLVPGFLGSDSYLSVLSGWLRRIGYDPYPSGVPLMAGSPAGLLDRIVRRVDQLSDATGRPVTVIGHSMGGMLGRLMVQLRPDRIAHLVTLGSPLTDDPRGASHPLVAALADVLVADGVGPVARARSRAAEGRLMEMLVRPLPDAVRLTCVYSREDAVVHWRACIDGDGRAVSHEVQGSHVGLAWNAQVYRYLGRSLLQPVTAAGEW